MPRNGAGSYTLPSGNPVVTGTTISSTVQNNTMSDIATALSASIANDGQTTILADLPMSNHKLTGLANGVASGDSVNIGQLAASGGSALIGFLQAGTGAVTRTIQDKAREFVSAKDFGAVGDGVTNDTAAIQAAITYAGTLVGSDAWANGGVGVRLPFGEYLVNASLTLPNSGVGIYGDPGRGAKIVVTGNIPAFIVGDQTDATTTYNVHFSWLYLYASGGANTATAIKAYRTLFGSVTNCNIRNFDTGFYGLRANRWRIIGNQFSGERSTLGTAHIRLAGSASGNGGGIHIDECELGNSSGALLPDYNAAILVENCDGLYVGAGVHSRDVNYGILVAPDGTTGKNFVSDLKFDQYYADENYIAPVRLAGSVAAGGFYQEIDFTTCLLRGGNQLGLNSTNVVQVDISDAGGFTAGGGVVKGLRFTGSEMRQALQTGFKANGAGASKLEVHGLQVVANRFDRHNGSNLATASDIDIEAYSAVIDDNSFGPAAFASANCVKLILTSGSQSSAVILDSNDFSEAIYTDYSPVTTGSEMVGSSVILTDNMMPGAGKYERNVWKGQTTDRGSVILWKHVVNSAGEMVTVRAKTVGCSTTGTAGTQRAEYEHSVGFYRVASGTAAAEGSTVVRTYDNVTGNAAPVALTLLTGTAWVGGAAAGAGALITSGGNVYMTIVAGNLDATTPPSHTSGAAANGTTVLSYISAIGVNTVALVVSGSASDTIQWASQVERISVP